MIKVAKEEHDKLMDTVRHRLINSVNANRNTLNKEKDKFDITDTSALRFYPNHFSITNPASPGGPQNNRKTRHTRHRVDIDDLSAVGESNKRKRKAPADADNDSPGPNGRVGEGEVPQAWKESEGAREAHHNAPLYTIDRLFTEKELDMNLQDATLASVDHFSNKTNKTNGDTLDGNSTEGHMNGNASDEEEDDDDDEDIVDDIAMIDKGNTDNEDIFLTAPGMDRTANNSVHVTRSTRTFTLNPNAPSALGGMAGRKSAIRFMGTQKKTKSGDDITKGGSPLNDQEINDDFAMIAAAIKDEEEHRGRTNKQMLQDLVPERQDYVSAACTGRHDLSHPYVSNVRSTLMAAHNSFGEDNDLYN